MTENTVSTLEPNQKQRLLRLFERLLPLVDSLADKLRLMVALGLLVTIWLVAWFWVLKHYSVTVSASVGFAALLPTLVLARFWWAVAELKNLPDIAQDAMGDAKAELQASVQNIRAGKAPKLGLFSISKSVWSLGSMAADMRELLGSYLSIATLFNPFMLILGFISFLGVVTLLLVGIVLVFFV